MHPPGPPGVALTEHLPPVVDRDRRARLEAREDAEVAHPPVLPREGAAARRVTRGVAAADGDPPVVERVRATPAVAGQHAQVT